MRGLESAALQKYWRGCDKVKKYCVFESTAALLLCVSGTTLNMWQTLSQTPAPRSEKLKFSICASDSKGQYDLYNLIYNTKKAPHFI